MLHIVSLIGTEFPMMEHRQWLGVTQMPRGASEPKRRQPLKRRLLLGMGNVHPRCNTDP